MIGRHVEMARLREKLDAIVAGATSASEGHAVLLTGEAGIGKTTLLDQFASVAHDAGFGQLRCSGVEQEADIGFSGLHELLQPALNRVDLLPPQQRATLMAVFGLDSGETLTAQRPPDRLLINTASLALLEEMSAEQPMLILVEDLQWLDASSTAVLTFLIRRLAHTRTLLLGTLRTGEAPMQQWLNLGMDHLALGALSGQESAILLDELKQPLDEQTRALFLEEADGNPLALVDLSGIAESVQWQSEGVLPVRLPLPQRLERLFLRQVEKLPELSQRFLLLAAAQKDPQLSEVVQAGEQLGLFHADLDPAETAGLIDMDGERIRFRHPLVRSAIYGAAPSSSRMQAHLALAAAVQDPVRAAWHKAAATRTPDEDVAAELATAGEIARARGALIEAAAAYERAAALSPGPRATLERTVQAAELAWLAGRPVSAAALADQARPLLEDPRRQPALAVRAAVTRWRLSAGYGHWLERITDLVDVADRLGGPDGTEHPVERVSALVAAAAGAYILQLPEELRRRVHIALGALQLPMARAADQQIGLIMLDPLRYAQQWRGRLDAITETVSAPNRLAWAAEAIHDLPVMNRLWDIAVERTHYSREVSEECLALHGRALARVVSGDLLDACIDANLAERIAFEAQSPIIGAAGMVAAALAYTHRGDLPAAAAALQQAASVIDPTPVGRLHAELHWAGGLLALLEGRHWDAWVHLRQTTSHPVVNSWAIADLTEAAVRVGKGPTVAPLLEEIARANASFRSPHLSLLAERSRALLAGDKEAEALFVRSAEYGHHADAPVESARTQLMYGEWLRRQGRAAEAQEQLTRAWRTFIHTSARSWAARADAELRAAGVTLSHDHESDLGTYVSTLTAQELQIAQLASTGMTDKEIADRVYLSHRTVSRYLQRVFAKLGIMSRAHLARALGANAKPMRSPP